MIHRVAGRRPLRIMEVCGTHTAAIYRFGIRGMIPETIRLISGPGCPVCVTGDGYLENALVLARDPRVIIATYHDMLRVPVKKTSLEKARSEGADVRGVVSALDAVTLARQNPGREIVFLGVGFETTAPATAVAVLSAQKERLKNFSVYSAHKTIPEALGILGRDKELALDGFLLPGHVSAIIGRAGYEAALARIRKPSVICGF
jgi:hydrogenase expression/formation protein HypD